MEYYTRDGIGGEIYSLAHGDAVHLSLTIIGYHPYIVIIHDASQHLTRLYQLAFVNVLSSHHAIAGCHDYGIGKVEASQIELCLCHALSGTGTAELLGLHIADRSCTCLAAACLLITRLGSQIAGISIVILLTGYRILLHQSRKTVEVLLGIHHIHTSFLDAGSCCLHIGIGGAHAGSNYRRT